MRSFRKKNIHSRLYDALTINDLQSEKILKLESRIKELNNSIIVKDNEDELFNVVIKNEYGGVLDVSFHNENGQLDSFELSPSQLFEILNNLFDDRLK